MYWQASTRARVIADVMARDRIFVPRTALHFVDTQNVSDDTTSNRLWKVQPITDTVRSGCLKIHRVQINYSIDEQMIPFTGRSSLSQYVPNKPRPRGLKNFVLASSKCLVLDFEVYQGKTTPLPETHLGLSPSVVLCLMETLPVNSSVFFDWYFTTVPLLNSLLDRGLEGTGTILRIRVKDVHLSVTGLQNEER
jgi:hypothetical protein